MGFMNSLSKWKEQAPDSKTTNAINAMPGQEAPKFGTETTPQMNQLPMYHDGGDVPSDQVAKLKGGERVLNPTEAHAYKSAAIGNAPDTPLGRISARANEILDQQGQAEGEADENSKSIRAKSDQMNALKEQGDAQMRPLQPRTPPASMAPVEADKIHPNATYGSRPGEKRLDDQGNVIQPTTPTGLGAVGPKLPVPTALGKLPSYDEGGDVPNDQIAKVHEDEHVLDPKEAAAYRQAEKEVMNNAPLGHGNMDEGSERSKANTPLGGQMDTEGAAPQDKVEGAKMSDDNYFEGDAGMQQVKKSPLGQAGPPSSSLKPLPGSKTPIDDAVKQAVGASDMGPDVSKTPPATSSPEDIIKQDKLDAMKSGDLVKLGMAHINERSLKAGGPPALPQPTAPTARENIVNQEKQLRDKMINGQTEQERFQAEKDLAELKRRTPWGSEGSAHPGLLGKIGHVAGQVGQAALMATAPYALPMIPGSKANLEESAARGEQGVEGAQKKEFETARIAEEKNMPEVARQRADIAQQAADVKQQEADTKQERVESQEVLDSAKANAQNAIAELKQAQADPNSPQSQAVLAKMKNAARMVDIAAGKLGLDGDKYKAEYLGVDHDGNPLAGAQTDDAGRPIGPKVAKGNEPSAQQLNKANLAHNVQENILKAKALIDKNPDLFGKAAGRITTFEQLMGSDDPSIGQIQTIVYNVGLAAGGIHSQRGLAAAQHAAQLLLNGFKNGPEATKAALDEMSGSVQTFIDDARAGKKIVHHASEVNPAGGTPTAPGTPAGETPFQKWERENKK